MEEIKDRVKAVRKALGLTQQQFADRLQMAKPSISAIEYGTSGMSERTISNICREFEVSEEWFRTGQGEMFAPKTREKEIADIAKQLLYAEDDDFRASLIEMIAGMPSDMIEYLKNWTLSYAEKVKEKELP